MESLKALMTVLVLVPSFTNGAIDDYLNRYYSYESSENFGAVLNELGLWYMRPMALLWHPTDYLQKSGQNIAHKYFYWSSSPFYRAIQDFELGETNIIETIDGRTVKSTITADKDTLHEVQVEANGRTTTIDRKFTKDTLTITIEVGHVIAVRRHKSSGIRRNLVKEEEKKKKKMKLQKKAGNDIFITNF